MTVTSVMHDDVSYGLQHIKSKVVYPLHQSLGIIEMFPTSLLAALLVFLTILPTAHGLVVRKSPITLALSRQLSATGLKNLYQHDCKRARFLKARGGHAKRQYKPTPQDSAVSHVATVGVGAGVCEFSNNDTLHPLDCDSSNW